MTPQGTIIEHTGEMTRVRFWQEVALRALPAVIEAHKPPTLEVETAAFRDWSQRVSSVCWELAEKMFKGHGPSVEPGIVGHEKYIKDRVSDALAKAGH